MAKDRSPEIRAARAAHPRASYAELARIVGCHESTARKHATPALPKPVGAAEAGVAYTPTPFTPENILEGDDGRWHHNGYDVTDVPVWWRCAQGHTWQASVGHRTSPNDNGCPTCAAQGPQHTLSYFDLDDDAQERLRAEARERIANLDEDAVLTELELDTTDTLTSYGLNRMPFELFLDHDDKDILGNPRLTVLLGGQFRITDLDPVRVPEDDYAPVPPPAPESLSNAKVDYDRASNSLFIYWEGADDHDDRAAYHDQLEEFLYELGDYLDGRAAGVHERAQDDYQLDEMLAGRGERYDREGHAF